MECTVAVCHDIKSALWTIAIFWACTTGVVAKFTPYAKPVSLDTVSSLVFQRWKITNFRRNMPIYQLKCLSGCDFEPDWVKCFSAARRSRKGPSWRCEADLPSHLQFATLEILCEGYDSRDDNRILEGSCGLEYTLKHTVQTTKNPLAEDGTPENELQWNEFQWLVLCIVIYACCHCLYQVVQSDLKEALNSTHKKTAGCQTFDGRCRKCQSNRILFTDHIGEMSHPGSQNWLRDTPSESQCSTEQATIPLVCTISPACKNRTEESQDSTEQTTRPHVCPTSPARKSRLEEPSRSSPTCPSKIRLAEPHQSPPASPRNVFFKKLERPSRSRKRNEFSSPGL